MIFLLGRVNRVSLVLISLQAIYDFMQDLPSGRFCIASLTGEGVSYSPLFVCKQLTTNILNLCWQISELLRPRKSGKFVIRLLIIENEALQSRYFFSDDRDVYTFIIIRSGIWPVETCYGGYKTKFFHCFRGHFPCRWNVRISVELFRSSNVSTRMFFPNIFCIVLYIMSSVY